MNFLQSDELRKPSVVTDGQCNSFVGTVEAGVLNRLKHSNK